MTNRSDPDAATAMQYLVWALEYIEKTGDLRLCITPALPWKPCASVSPQPSRSPTEFPTAQGLIRLSSQRG